MTVVPEQIRPTSSIINRVEHYVRAVVARIGFWLAITLPFLYIPLLVTGLETPPMIEAFIFLLVLHAGTVYVGQWY